MALPIDNDKAGVAGRAFIFGIGVAVGNKAESTGSIECEGRGAGDAVVVAVVGGTPSDNALFI